MMDKLRHAKATYKVCTLAYMHTENEERNSSISTHIQNTKHQHQNIHIFAISWTDGRSLTHNSRPNTEWGGWQYVCVYVLCADAMASSEYLPRVP